MIKIQVNKNDEIENIVISGHSGYDTEGHDIVCAGVSSISTTTVNAIISIDDKAITYKVDKGYLKIIINKHNEVIDKLINNMLNLIKEMESKYPKYIKIN